MINSFCSGNILFIFLLSFGHINCTVKRFILVVHEWRQSAFCYKLEVQELQVHTGLNFRCNSLLIISSPEVHLVCSLIYFGSENMQPAMTVNTQVVSLVLKTTGEYILVRPRGFNDSLVLFLC